MDVNVGIERYHIRDLAPDISNIVVIAIIIGKREARTFSKDNVTKAVWNCTIRDSPYDYINLTYWGTEEIILPLYEKFQIGDISKLTFLFNLIYLHKAFCFFSRSTKTESVLTKDTRCC